MTRVLAVVLFCLPFSAQASILRIHLNDMIHPISDEYIGRGLESAARAKDAAVVIELSTPRGVIDPTPPIVEEMMTSRVPVIVFVSPARKPAPAAGFFLFRTGGRSPLGSRHHHRG